MAITKKIVDMLGGTIEVQSEEDQGSEFIVKLPCKICSERIEQVTPSMPSTIDETKESPLQADFIGKRVLLAEDNELNQMIAVENLEKVGFAVEVANDGLEAVEKMIANPSGYYDVILMDIQMPKMDGYEAALKAGMNKHLAKPYDTPQFIQTLYSLLYTAEQQE